jgi:hypothetical protein
MPLDTAQATRQRAAVQGDSWPYRKIASGRSAHARVIVNRIGSIMSRSLASSVDPLIRQAHIERARHIEALLQRGVAALDRLLHNAIHAVRDLAQASSEAAYLAHARNHADLKRRYLILECEHQRIAPDVGR